MHPTPDLKVLWKIYQPVFISLSLLVILYLLLRLANLTLLPIFVDEAIYIRWAQVMKAEATLRFLPLSDGKQPLFMWALMPVLKIVPDPLLAGRLLSVATGLGSMLGIFFLTLQLTKSQKHALTASLLSAVVPFTLFFDRLALVDSMLMMWGVWGLYFALRHTEKPALDMSLLAGGTLGLAWLTKTPAMILLVLVPLTLLASDKYNPGVVSTLSKNLRKALSFSHINFNLWKLNSQSWYLIKLICGWIVILGLAFIIYNILRLGPEFHQIAIRNKDYIYPWAEIIARPWGLWQPNIMALLSFWWGLLTPPVLILAVWGWLTAGEFKSRFRWWLLLWILLPSALQVGLARSVTARYFLYTVPAWLILASIGLQGLLMKWKWQFSKVVLVLVIFTPILWIDLLLLFRPVMAPLPRIERSGYLEEWTAGVGLREIASYIQQESNAQRIVVGTEGFFGTMPDGLQIYFDKNPNVTILGQSYIIDKVSQQLYDSWPQNKVYLLINESRMKIPDTDAAGLRLIRKFPKAIRPDGSRESLMWFELVNKPEM